MLWRDLKVSQIFGANTDVGKTIVSTVVCKALLRRAPADATLYIKPVSTGPIEEADDRHVKKFVPGIISKCISQFSQPVSPHLAARDSHMSNEIPRDDKSILHQLRSTINRHAQAGGRYAILETAGGVLSPAPSGTVQADFYRPLRLPTVLVGDYRLGGISCTISAFESLHLRGYDVDSIILFEDSHWGNTNYLQDHFSKHDVRVFSLPKPPQRRKTPKEDDLAMLDFYEETSNTATVGDLLDRMHEKHFFRTSKLSSMPLLANSVVWHPFRQHGLPQELIAIDSAYGDHFQAHRTPPAPEDSQSDSSPKVPSLTRAGDSSSESLLSPLFDGSASWWTQGLGHGNPDLSLTAAYAAGRYGHVMFANAVHEPAIDLSYNLLSVLENPRLTRVFFTDNGSTGMEVAIKMALRASSARYGWSKRDAEVEVLGLSGSYHGDTIGVMNCCEPSVYNEKVDWHRPVGFWFDPPQLKMRQGKWRLDLPKAMLDDAQDASTQNHLGFSTLDEVFDMDVRVQSEIGERYRDFIKTTLDRLVRDDGRKFGALILEPVIMGAGGMILVDPLFQRTLIEEVRKYLFCPTAPATQPPQTPSTPGSPPDLGWTGVPVIADEVFTGLYRLGRASSSSFLCRSRTSSRSSSSSDVSGAHGLEASIAPDISVHAKLLTGGLLPLALTTASEAIFAVFLSDRKQDALLHGHSYTAHAVGCAVANKSLKELARLDGAGKWDRFKTAWGMASAGSSQDHQTPQRHDPSTATSSAVDTVGSKATPRSWSFWSPGAVTRLSHSAKVEGIVALGTVLAITLRTEGGGAGGYTSNAAAALQTALLSGRDDEGAGVHSRVLGDVLYLMTSLTTEQAAVTRIEDTLCRILC